MVASSDEVCETIVAAIQVQQDLARPGVLERFVPGAEDAKLLRSCFAGMSQLLAHA